MQIPGYDIKKTIANGEAATVFLAIQQSLGREVVLKVLPKNRDGAHSARFLEEGRVLASLSHHNVITVHDVGVSDQWYYIAMEYLRGGSLKDRIEHGMSVTAVLDLMETLVGCLDFLHKKGIVHRDVKPENILFQEDGTPKLTDFGIAKQLVADQDLTMDGMALGSPYYLSPEQAAARPLDGRSDIYSLGIVFYEMLTGHKPYRGDSHFETMMAHLNREVPRLEGEAAVYQEMLNRMIAKDPDDRFASAAELLGYLRALRYLGGGSGKTLPKTSQHDSSGTLSDGGRDSGRRPAGSRLNKLLAAALAAGLLLAVVLLMPSMDGDKPMADGGLVTEEKGVSVAVEGDDGRDVVLAADDAPPSLPLPVTGTPDESVTVFDVSAYSGEEDAPEPAPAVMASESAPLPEVEATAPLPMTNEPAGEDKDAFLAHTEDAAAFPEGDDLATAPIGPMTTVVDDGGTAGGREVPGMVDVELISQWLGQARTAMAEYRLTTPEGDNAQWYFEQVLAEEPGNAEAASGLDEIADSYQALARQKLSAGKRGTASLYVDRGLTVRPSHGGLLALRGEIARANREAARRRESEGANPVSRFFNNVRGFFADSPPRRGSQNPVIDH